MFVIKVNYIKPLIEVEPLIPAHRDFLDIYYQANKFIVSGRRNPADGGIIIAHNATKEELEKIVTEDPFYTNQVATYEIIEFTPTKYHPDFNVFIK